MVIIIIPHVGFLDRGLSSNHDFQVLTTQVALFRPRRASEIPGGLASEGGILRPVWEQQGPFRDVGSLRPRRSVPAPQLGATPKDPAAALQHPGLYTWLRTPMDL